MVRVFATIWFRLLVIYSAATIALIVLVLPEDKPWTLQGRDILDDKPLLCAEIPPEAAADQVAADKQRLAELTGAETAPAFSQEFLTRLLESTDQASADLKERFMLPTCIEYRERLAAWHASARPNWKSRDYWNAPSRRALLFVIPAWLVWGAVYWAVFAPLLRKEP